MWLLRIDCVYLQFLFAKYWWFMSLDFMSFRLYLKPRPACANWTGRTCPFLCNFENANEDSATLSKRAYSSHQQSDPENVWKISDTASCVRLHQSANCIKYCSSTYTPRMSRNTWDIAISTYYYDYGSRRMRTLIEIGCNIHLFYWIWFVSLFVGIQLEVRRDHIHVLANEYCDRKYCSANWSWAHVRAYTPTTRASQESWPKRS